MKLAGVGAFAGTGTVLSTLETSAASSTNDTVVLDQDFEDIAVGEYPSDWKKDGNMNQSVTTEIAYQGEKSLSLHGSHGGCWQAVANAPLKFPDESQLEISFAFRPTTNGSFGCHPYRGAVNARTDTGWWGAGNAITLMRFDADGTVSSHGETVGKYTTNEWNQIEIRYHRKKSTTDEKVIVDVSVNGESKTFERSPRSFESQLKYLTFRSGDFTTQIDTVRATKGTTNNPASQAVVWPDSIDFGPVISGSSPVRPLVIANPSTNTNSIEVEEINTPSDASLITGEFFDSASWLNVSEVQTEIKPGESALYGIELSQIGNSMGNISGEIPINISGVDFSVPFTGTSMTDPEGLKMLSTISDNISDLFKPNHLEEAAIANAIDGLDSLKSAAEDRAAKNYISSISHMTSALKSFNNSIDYSMAASALRTAEIHSQVSGVSSYVDEYSSDNEKYKSIPDYLDSAANQIANGNTTKAAREYEKAVDKARAVADDLDKEKTAEDLRDAMNTRYTNTCVGSVCLDVGGNDITREMVAEMEEYLNEVTDIASDFTTLLDNAKSIFISADSPVDLQVHTGNDQVVNKDTSEVADAKYLETDIDADGEREDLLLISESVSGISKLDVIPEQGASPSETYSLASIIDGKTELLEEDVELQNRPENGYVLGSDPVLNAEIDINPNTLSKKSKGKFVTAYIQLPEGYGVRSLQEDAVELNGQVDLQEPVPEELNRSIIYLATLINNQRAETLIELNATNKQVERTVEGYVSAALQSAIDAVVSVLQSENITGKVLIQKVIDWGQAVSTIDLSSVKLNEDVGAISDERYGFVKNIQMEDRDGDGLPELMVKFPRGQVADILTPDSSVEVKISGLVNDGSFVGYDSLKVIGPKFGKPRGK